MSFVRRVGPLVGLLVLGAACNQRAPITPDLASGPEKPAPTKPAVTSPVKADDPFTQPVTVSAVSTAAKPAPAPQVSLDVTPSTSLVSSGKAGDLFVRVRLTGLPLAAAKRPPINLVLVVDTSGSMEGAAIERARDACATLVDSLGEGDALSIVTFGSETHVIVPASRITNDKRALAREAISKIKAEGTTDMAGGLQAGLGQVRTFLQNDGINRIVLVGDGVPNDPTPVLGLADQALSLHVPITTLGLGGDFDETEMTAVAQRSGGTFHFVEDASRVAKVFQDELSKMQRLVARGTFVDVTPGPGVVIDDVIGLAHQPIGRAMRIPIGDMSEGQVRDVVLHLTTPNRHESSKIELLDAVTHYTTTSTEATLEARRFVGLTASADAKAVASAHDADVEHQAARVRVADDMVRAMALARAGDLKGARALLDKAAKLATDEGKRFEDADLKSKAKEVASLKKTIASLAPPPPQVLGGGERMKRPEFASPPPSPAAAMQLRSAHGAAMDLLQGQ